MAVGLTARSESKNRTGEGEGRTLSQEEWVWWACRMVSCDPVPGKQRLAQICRRRFYLRGVEASTAPPLSVKFPGCEAVWLEVKWSGALHVLSSGEVKGKSVVFLRRLSKVFGGAKSEMISRGR
ncbi:hypothetical protein YC2023_087098 [Brassica napus]